MRWLALGTCSSINIFGTSSYARLVLKFDHMSLLDELMMEFSHVCKRESCSLVQFIIIIQCVYCLILWNRVISWVLGLSDLFTRLFSCLLMFSRPD